MALPSLHVPRPTWLLSRCCNLYHRDEISSLKYHVTALAQHWHKDENRMWSWGHVAFFPVYPHSSDYLAAADQAASGLVRGRGRCGPLAWHMECGKLSELVAMAICSCPGAGMCQGTYSCHWDLLDQPQPHCCPQALGATLVGAGMCSSSKCGTGHHKPLLLQLFQRGAVVTDAARCTALGTHVLARHGSSVDAAITSALCAGIVNPHTSGLGG